MLNKLPKPEQHILNKLVDAHNAFTKLDVTHDSELKEWVISLHRLQHILMARIVRRDYPNTFTNNKNIKDVK